MKKYVHFIFLLFYILSGCGASDEVSPTPYIDDRIISIVRAFEDLYKVEVDYQVYITSEVLASDTNVIGTCQDNSKDPKRVRIVQSFWDSNLYARRRALVFHELAHCSFGLHHNDTERDMEVWSNLGNPIQVVGPYSLMHSRMFSVRFYMDPIFTRYYIPQLWEEIESKDQDEIPEEFLCFE